MNHVLRATILVLSFAVLVLLIIRQAHSSPACMTMHEARAAYPRSHIWWHGRAHCWDANPGRKIKKAAKKAGPKPVITDDPNGNKVLKKLRPPPPQHVTTIWPSLIADATPLNAQLFLSVQTTRWPKLIDVDELTAEAPLPDCCWPPLEEQQVSFNDRWQEVPVIWPRSTQGETQ